MHHNHTMALRYAAAGYKIIPCYYDPESKKKPPIHDKDWRGKASDKPERINEWFNSPHGGWKIGSLFVKNEHVLIGFPTGADNGIDALDIDKHGDVDGHLTIPNWAQLSKVISETPTGGHHILHAHVPSLRLKNEAGELVYNGKRIKLPGIDIRTSGGYIILPGSTLPDGRQYKWHLGDIVTSTGEKSLLVGADLELITLKTRESVSPPAKKGKHKVEVVENEDLYKNRAITWVGKQAADVAQAQPGTRDDTLKNKMYAAGSVVHAGLVTEDQYRAAFWAAVCESGLDKDGVTEAVMDKKVRDALDASRNAEIPEHLRERDWLKELNDKHFFLENEGGKTAVGEWIPNAQQSGFEISLQATKAFSERYMDQVVKVGDDYMEMGKAWLKHLGKRKYHSIAFDPEAGEVDAFNRLNMWRGMAIKASPGYWNRLHGHIYRVLAQRNPEIYRYIIRWAAWAVLNPGKPAEVALILRGGQGVGKGLFARSFVRIFGQHGKQITSANDLAGTFSGHLSDCCLLFADEAISPRDIAAANRLKAMITEPELSFRAMYKESRPMKNVIKVIMASNEAHVSHVEVDDRRNAVFDCKLDVKGIMLGRFKTNQEYMDWLHEQLNDEGYAAMLHDLIHIDLGKWKPREGIPDTEARREQKHYTSNPMVDQLNELIGELEGTISWYEAVLLTRIQPAQFGVRQKQWLGQALKELGWERIEGKLQSRKEVVKGEKRKKLPTVYTRGESSKQWLAATVLEQYAAQKATELSEQEQKDVDELLNRANNDDEITNLFPPEKDDDVEDGGGTDK